MVRFFILTFFLSFFVFEVKSIDFIKGDLENAKRISVDSGKPILIYFTAVWCGPCKYMEKYIFSDEKVILESRYQVIPLKMDVDTSEGKELYQRLHQNAISVPLFLVITSKEEIIKIHSGAMNSSQLIRFFDTGIIKSESQKKEIGSIESDQELNVIKPKPSLFRKMAFNASVNKWKPGVALGSGFGLKPISSGFLFHFRTHLDYSTPQFLLQPGLEYARRPNGNLNNPSQKNQASYLRAPLRFGLTLFKPRILGSRMPLRIETMPFMSVNLHALNSEFVKPIGYGGRIGSCLTAGSFDLSFGYEVWQNDYSIKMLQKGMVVELGITLSR